jgi:hypothetical protein
MALAIAGFFGFSGFLIGTSVDFKPSVVSETYPIVYMGDKFQIPCLRMEDKILTCAWDSGMYGANE